MKKDLIFTPIMLIIGVLLFLLSKTGLLAHMIISVLGIIVLIAYTIVSKKTWKNVKLEIIMRAFYGIAFISGVVIKIKSIQAVAIIHKACGALFVLMLIVLLVYKFIVTKNKK